MANQQQGRDQSGNESGHESNKQGNHQTGNHRNGADGTNRRTDGARSGSGNQAGQGKERRGFAAMDQQKQREIASMGGHAAHRSGNAHEFDSEEAREAGRKGGLASAQNRAEQARNGDGNGQENRGNGERTGHR